MWHPGQGQEIFLAEVLVWLFFWDSRNVHAFLLPGPFKFAVGLLALSEPHGTSGGVSLQQH